MSVCSVQGTSGIAEAVNQRTHFKRNPRPLLPEMLPVYSFAGFAKASNQYLKMSDNHRELEKGQLWLVCSLATGKKIVYCKFQKYEE